MKDQQEQINIELDEAAEGLFNLAIINHSSNLFLIFVSIKFKAGEIKIVLNLSMQRDCLKQLGNIHRFEPSWRN
jgi:hypothetical protein